MFFKKLPVVIEAVQFNGTTRWDEAPQWLIEATRKHFAAVGAIYITVCENPDSLTTIVHASINTLEGVMTASPGDYIIRGVNGELYPCKPDIFAKTYEACEDNTSDELLTETRSIAKGLNDLNTFMASNDFPKLTRPEKDLFYSQQRAMSKLVQVLGKRLELRNQSFTHK